MNRDDLLKLATSQHDTPFDYVIVGSGAGGGPLAARLALGGCRVLLIDAGVDPAQEMPGMDPRFVSGKAAPGMRQVYAVPCFHGPATEDDDMSWEFSVRHYTDTAQQKLDKKYFPCKDPSESGAANGAASGAVCGAASGVANNDAIGATNSTASDAPNHDASVAAHSAASVEASNDANRAVGKGGILYPRAAAIGGCTAHHAMIIIRPNDRDWDHIAELTNDASWRSENMQGYFAKIEQCLYYSVYNRFAGPLVGALHWIAKQLNPRRQLNPNGHGFNGWQMTSFIDPIVIAGIVRADKTFVSVLKDIAFSALASRGERLALIRAIVTLQVLRFFDPNVRSPNMPTRNHLSLISIATDGKRRYGLRDHLFDVAKRYPDRLVMLNPAHATRVLFEHSAQAPRAVGVEVLMGAKLYRASPKPQTPDRDTKPLQVYARREVIISGGAFNTPQLLMLSGIGDRDHLAQRGVVGPRDSYGNVVAPIVHLPGVGLNLQDRYEVSVISEANQDFSTLKDATFRPGDPNDPVLKQWQADGSGLYSTNGGAIAMMLSSKVNPIDREVPDLFVFGVPAAFRGYYWKWSEQLLSKTMNAPPESRNLWSWVILKAYTDNNQGTVRLLSDKPLEPPQIDFHSFDDTEAGAKNCSNDISALCDAIGIMRKFNGSVRAFNNEVQPGAKVPNDSDKLREWIKYQAWGHHACGTCRIGADAWRADTGHLRDSHAVLDSRFRVHGVQGLRVVDTSAFPSIPGYFIVAPTFMIGEKAADLLLADTDDYPHALEAKEAAAILRRRELAGVQCNDAPAGSAARDNAMDPEANCADAQAEVAKLPDDTVGLALSGGGIRSATFCLGVIQALARRRLLHEVDIMSSVSGGGYTASFIGRLFTRLPDAVSDKARRVEESVANPDSPEIDWLRSNAQYITGGGRRDLLFDIAVVLRNLASVHVWLGTLLLGTFGLIEWFALAHPCLIPMAGWCGTPAPVLFGLTLSVWWWLPLAVFAFGVLPPAFGYWLTLQDNLRRNWRAWLPLLAWLVLLGAATTGLSLPAIANWSALAIGILLFAWIEQEAVRWRVPTETAPRKWGTRDDPDRAPPQVKTTVVRNRLTRLLGVALFGLLVSALWVVLDTVADQLSSRLMQPLAWSALGAIPLLPVLRGFAVNLLKSPSQPARVDSNGLVVQLLLGVLAFALAFVLLLFLDALAHFAFRRDPSVSHWGVVATLLISAVVGRTLAFLNLSSLQQAYSQKLVRTFLGASNPARVNPAGTAAPIPVNVSNMLDDIEFDDYHPEHAGGPLHLVGACVNNTVDPLSGNQLRDDKGMAVCAGPAGISVGRRFHALWGKREPHMSPRLAPVTALRVDPDPHQFHVLARSSDKPVLVERLRLGQWMAISGAAFTTGTGRNTRLAQALLLGLLNIRIGYWWNSGIAAGQRPGRYPPSVWRRIKALPSTLFTLQASLLNEWRAYFAGPAARLWYLSDGGHFDNSGLYELIRRRLPIMIAVDATADPKYQFESIALLTRQVRLDFCATLSWLDPTAERARVAPHAAGWSAFVDPNATVQPPVWFREHLAPEAIGAFAELKRDSTRGAALARITYADAPATESWLLLVKPCLFADLPADVRHYADTQGEFPNQTTLDQFFNDDQWEAYRMLGQMAGEKVFKEARPLREPGNPPATATTTTISET